MSKKNPNIPDRGCGDQAAAAIIYGARLTFDDDLGTLFGNLISDRYQKRRNSVGDEEFFDDEACVGITFKNVPYVLWQANNKRGSYLYLMYKHLIIRETDEKESEYIVDISNQQNLFRKWLKDHNIPLECGKYLLLIHPS